VCSSDLFAVSMLVSSCWCVQCQC